MIGGFKVKSKKDLDIKTVYCGEVTQTQDIEISRKMLPR